MENQYKTLKPVGRWAIGQTIGDLPKAQIIQLLQDGAIEEIKESKNPKSENKTAPKKINPGDNSND